MNMLIVTRRGLVAEEWVGHIEKRDRLMVDADHLVNSAMDMELDVTPFRQYRQALRDIPQNYTNPEDVVWPQKPSLPQASV